MARPTLRRASTATALALLACMGVAAASADARPIRVKGAQIIDAKGHPLTLRGVAWGGDRFVPQSAAATLPPPDIATASADFRRIRRMGGNLVRVDVSRAADDDAHRLAFQRLQRLARAHGLQILFANVPLDDADQTPWLTTLAGWLAGKPNVWFLPETDPNCGVFTASSACTDSETWIWTQGNAIRALRAAGVRTPIVVNTPEGSRSVSLDWAHALDDDNLVYGVHPSAEGATRFTPAIGHALDVSLRDATAKVPIVFDRIARVQTTVQLQRTGTENAVRWTRTSSTTTDNLRWSSGLLDWVTGWTMIDGGDGAIVDGLGTSTRDRIGKGRSQFTAWGRTAASGYFAITYRDAAGRDPGTGFPGGFEYGDKGPGVRAFQESLARTGFLGRDRVSGVFDDATWQGVVAFQGYLRQERTGSVGAETLALMDRGVVPEARFPERGKHIEIDISRGIVLLVNGDGSVRRVIHTSTGVTGNTPDGEFTVIRRERMSWNYKYKLWMPYAQYFFEGFALHEYPDVPAYPASHGCARLHASNAPVVWDFGSMGMPVILYHSGGTA